MAPILTRLMLSIIGILAVAATLSAQTTAADTPPPKSSNQCPFATESFPLKQQDLNVTHADRAISFTAGMTIDADGAPNAYAPRNRGLDYTANAKGTDGWVALVTDEKGHPIVQKSGPYRGYYVSTTSLQQSDLSDQRNPKKYIDAGRIPYIALPSDFVAKFGINLGDLAVVVNRANGRSAYAIFADIGPAGTIGEGSIALAKALGIPANPRHDSVADGITYLIFPGSALQNGKRITARSVRSSAARLYHRWGGIQRLRVCDLLAADTGIN